MNELDELLAEAKEILADPDGTAFRPLIMLKLLVALTEQVQQLSQAANWERQY